jgi:hypothetical protein
MLNTIAMTPAKRYDNPKTTVKTGSRPEIRYENVSLTK